MTTTKNLVALSHILIFYYFVLTFIACDSKQKANLANNPRIDSLLCQAKDSLNHNNAFSKSLIESAMLLVKDSDHFYNTYPDYINYYVTVNSYDTAYRMTKRLLYYANKQPMTANIHAMLTSAYNLMGIYHGQMCNLDSAIFFYLKAYKEANFNPDRSRIPDISINVADMYTRKGDYVNGILYYRRALTMSDSLHITDKMGFPIYFGLGQAYYMGLRNFELSDTYFRRAERLYTNRTLGEKFIFCNNRGNFYYYKEEYANALPWFRKAMALVTPSNNEFYINLCRGNMSDVFLQLNQLDSAKYNLDVSYHYFSNLQSYDILYYLTTVKVGLALKQGDLKLAKKLLKGYDKTTNVEPEFQSIRNKYLQNYYAKIGDFKQAYNYQAHNVKISDSLRTERVNSRIAEMDMRYRQDTAIVRHELLINKQNSEINTLRITNYFWILLAGGIFFLSALLYLFMRKKRDLQRVKFVDANAKLRLQNIQNRISPHLIFNVLNREISSEEDKEKHHEMIGLVKLLRRSLEITEQTSVTLLEEMDFVKSYLKLEQNKFDDQFRVNWEVDSRIDDQQWRVPAMIMQIPIENALKHALRPKVGDKLLQIAIKLHEKRIHIIIRDNGEGYHPERIVSTEGTGTGLKVIYQTIQLLNIKNNQKIVFSIDDIKDETLSGTKVEISVPEQYDFEL